MSEAKIKELKELLEAAARRDGDSQECIRQIGNLVLLEAMFDGLVVKNTDDGCCVRLEV